MILRRDSENLIVGIGEELQAKTLAVWNQLYPGAFAHYVPWLCSLPEGAESASAPALHHEYEPGRLLTCPSKLAEIEDYLNHDGGQLLAESIRDSVGAPYSIDVDTKQRQPWAEERVAAATSLVVNSHQYFDKAFLKLVHVIVPIDFTCRVGSSSDLARGAVFVSLVEENSVWELAVSMAHEFGHQVLMTLNSADPLIVSDIEDPVYSGVRLTERPAIQSLHAAAALSFMLLFVNSTTSNNHSRLSYANLLKQRLMFTVLALKAQCQFSEVGQAVMEDFFTACRG